MCLKRTIYRRKEKVITQHNIRHLQQHSLRETQTIPRTVVPDMRVRLTQNSGRVRLAWDSIASAPEVIHKRSPQKFAIHSRLVPRFALSRLSNADCQRCSGSVIAAARRKCFRTNISSSVLDKVPRYKIQLICKDTGLFGNQWNFTGVFSIADSFLIVLYRGYRTRLKSFPGASFYFQ